MAKRKKEPRPKVYYMHTLDGKPAEYSSKEKIIYFSGKGRTALVLIKSLRQIEKEQKMDSELNESDGFVFGYIRVATP